MLRIGVVPRNAVELKKREHLGAAFFEAFLVLDGNFRREAPITEGLHKATNVFFMLVQMPSLQAEFINRNDNALQEPTELRSKSLEVPGNAALRDSSHVSAFVSDEMYRKAG